MRIVRNGIIVFLFFSFSAISQIDSALTIPLLGVHFSGQLPYGDLGQRFGPSLNAGGSFMVKTKKNWIYGLESNYFFGRNVREDVMKQVKNDQGYITDNEGFPADLRITERGVGVHVYGGRVFKLGSVNPNSGLMIILGAGYMQHKINFYDAQRRVAAVGGDLKYGYDRLSAGISFTEFIGYLFLSENRLLNFYIGIENYQGLTHSLRKLNYDTGLRDTRSRFDALSGFRLGWILPLYKKTPNDFYYN